MESGRHDLASGTTTAEVNGTKDSVATYKSISDDDSNWQANNKPNEDKLSVMGKQTETVVIDDGAQEKMLNEEESNIVPAKEATEVKFIAKNGDAKIDIESVRKTLSGMGKEELMKYANDPFWIHLRWFLFIGFWLVWVGMLAGAIAIIVMAPMCSAPEQKKWWETSPIVQLEPDDIEGRDANSIASLLDNLKKQNIFVLSLSKFIDDDCHTKDFCNIQPRVGEKFGNIVKLAKERQQRVLLELDPNHSSLDHPWFKESVKRISPYTNYYVWADKRSGELSDERKPPNNWLSVNGGSAWEWNEERGQYYLHQFNASQPDLNYNNSAVIEAFGNILRYWLDRGINGFRLGSTRYLTEDPNLRDELQSSHVYTQDRLENGKVLGKWRAIVDNRTNKDGLFALRDNIGSDMLEVYNEKSRLIDLPQRSLFHETANSEITANMLAEIVNQSIAKRDEWPSWDIIGLRKRVFDPEIADSLTLMTLLLPGTPILKLNDTLSAKDAFATITKARTLQPFLYGDTETSVINGTVFVYTRLKSGNPGYLVAYQSSKEPAIIDLSNLKSMASEVHVYAHSSNYVQNTTSIVKKLSSDTVPISPKSTVVLTFVPKQTQT